MPATRLEPTPDTLADLLERIQGSDPTALRSLYELTSSTLFGLALRILVKREWAEDVLQDSYVKIWRHAGDYQASLSAPMTWLAAIVRNRALDHLRRVRANGEGEWDETPGEILPSNELAPPSALENSQEARQLAHCLGRLEPEQRQAIVLAYLRDQSHSEICTSLRVPLGTAKSWTRGGLEKLKSCLGAP
ncbi:RNA polymerase sigma factor [Pararobbsia alpina]|uniref:RNA polymerase sigma factor n=1 Tax=Pararobbsia alpina TaxID=621374 RepID=A0A6S7AX58_9BURK|nr:sigma-70 family RNA polymerase sigma factor [Pararobbsia alpina]CAB3776113.1 ECF RNA polymerase sigma factor SigK [Pararobbsia alpina]